MQSPLRIILELDENIALNWDLYLITILTLLMGLLIYLRRPPGPQPDPPVAPAAANNAAEAQPQQPEQQQPAPLDEVPLINQ